jgi:ribulose kinase
MRGSVVGLTLVGRVSLGCWVVDVSLVAQDDTINDLARKYNVTMEAIALQTKQIVDEMNGKGHEIRSIFVSGGQSKNAALMQLFANTCNMPVVTPHSSSTAVVTGAAMLGRLAAEASKRGGERNGSELWNIMVRSSGG